MSCATNFHNTNTGIGIIAGTPGVSVAVKENLPSMSRLLEKARQQWTDDVRIGFVKNNDGVRCNLSWSDGSHFSQDMPMPTEEDALALALQDFPFYIPEEYGYIPKSAKVNGYTGVYQNANDRAAQQLRNLKRRIESKPPAEIARTYNVSLERFSGLRYPDDIQEAARKLEADLKWAERAYYFTVRNARVVAEISESMEFDSEGDIEESRQKSIAISESRVWRQEALLYALKKHWLRTVIHDCEMVISKDRLYDAISDNPDDIPPGTGDVWVDHFIGEGKAGRTPLLAIQPRSGIHANSRIGFLERERDGRIRWHSAYERQEQVISDKAWNELNDVLSGSPPSSDYRVGDVMYVFDVSTSDPAETVQLEAIYHAQEEGGPRILASLRRDGECVALSTHTHTLDDEIVINESGGRKVFVRLVPAGDSIVG